MTDRPVAPMGYRKAAHKAMDAYLDSGGTDDFVIISRRDLERNQSGNTPDDQTDHSQPDIPCFFCRTKVPHTEQQHEQSLEDEQVRESDALDDRRKKVEWALGSSLTAPAGSDSRMVPAKGLKKLEHDMRVDRVLKLLEAEIAKAETAARLDEERMHEHLAVVERRGCRQSKLDRIKHLSSEGESKHV